MKNILNYYYHLPVTELYQVKKKYIFYFNNIQYIFLPFLRSLEEVKSLYLLNIELQKMNSNYHKIILNKNSQILTFVNQKPYILLQVNNLTNRKILLNDLQSNYILSPQQVKSLQPIIRSNWIKLWKEKLDYFEYQIEHFQNRYPILIHANPYFIGLGENAISYIQNTLIEEKKVNFIPVTTSHRRVSVLDEIIDFYDPTNSILDYRVRDIAEYLKSSFCCDNYCLEDIDHFLRKIQLNKIESRLLYGRMLFPSFYFDLYEEIINGYQQPETILTVIRRIPEYERFLYDLYCIIKKYEDIPSMAWLEKRFLL